MTESRQNRKEEEIFAVARAIASQDERREYLDQVCANDPETRREVEELLTIYDCERSFLESPPPDFQGSSSNDFATAEAPGTMIGPYKILDMIGEGGMGNVYLAEQIEPVHRKVALKIIKSGMDSKSVIARFDAERQALALMDHPNIAKFHDAGISESGSPYFVMEMVNGPTIVQFCQQHILDLLAELELFTQVCHGVQHAHQKGIIHRDLKPSNVLVALYDDHPVAKVIDFGVAKAMGDKLTDKTMFTRFGQLVGTLEYMSPEQAQLTQRDVDTRSDVYSLGAILYELLTGEPPFEKEKLSGDSLDEALRIIREEEPVKPSSRISQLHDGNRQSDSAQLRSSPSQNSSIPADLDWIVMKCLEKDRSRRYATTNDFVQDVKRYMHNEAILASPPSATYKIQKFYRRNKLAILVSSIVTATLICGTAISAWQAFRASQAETLAKNYLRTANENWENAKRETEKANKAISALENSLEELKKSEEKSNQQRAFIVEKLKSPLSVEEANWSLIHGTGGYNDHARDVIIQPDGKIVVTGVLPKRPNQSSQDMLVARYNADGTIDTSFNGSGYNVADFGKRSRDIGISITLQNDGKVVAVGTGYDYASGPGVGKDHYLIVARFDSDGSLDATYRIGPGTPGGEPYGDYLWVDDVLVQSSGKILILSTVKYTENNWDVLLTRLNSDFTIDTSFGSNGMIVHDFQGHRNRGCAMAQQSDSKIVVAGSAQNMGYFARFDADGTLDTSYAFGGEGTIDTSVNGSNNFLDLALDANDNAYLAGRSTVSTAGDDKEFVIVKLNSNGNIDTGFGFGGIFKYNLTSGPDVAKAIAIDQTGRLILVGGRAMIRVNADGILDASFGYDGSIEFVGNCELHSVVVDGLNRPVATGAIVSDTMNVWLLRIAPN